MIRKFSEIFAVTNTLKVSLVIHRTSSVYTQQKEGNFPFYVIKLYIHYAHRMCSFVPSTAHGCYLDTASATECLQRVRIFLNP